MSDETIKLVAVIKDCIVAIAAIIGSIIAILSAIAAWIGLNTWKRELAGNAKYTLAKNILVTVYEIRASVNRLRDRFISFEEARLSDDISKQYSPEDCKFFGHIQAYDKRLKDLDFNKLKLQSILLEAEAVWGKDKIACVVPLYSCLLNLRFYINQHVLNLHPVFDGQKKQSDTEEFEKIIYSQSRDDATNDELELAIKKIEDEFRPFLENKNVLLRLPYTNVVDIATTIRRIAMPF